MASLTASFNKNSKNQKNNVHIYVRNPLCTTSVTNVKTLCNPLYADIFENLTFVKSYVRKALFFVLGKHIIPNSYIAPPMRKVKHTNCHQGGFIIGNRSAFALCKRYCAAAQLVVSLHIIFKSHKLGGFTTVFRYLLLYFT